MINWHNCLNYPPLVILKSIVFIEILRLPSLNHLRAPISHPWGKEELYPFAFVYYRANAQISCRYDKLTSIFNIPTISIMSQFKFTYSIGGELETEKISIINSEDFVNFVQLHRSHERALARDGYIAMYCFDQFFKSSMSDNLQHKKVGLYGAFTNGPVLKNALNCENDLNFKWPPKQHFKHNAPFKTTHLTFLKKINGPQLTFTCPYNGVVDALNCAEIDLFSGVIDFAIVVSSFSADNEEVLALYEKSFSSIVEYGLCILLEKKPTLLQWKKNNSNLSNFTTQFVSYNPEHIHDY